MESSSRSRRSLSWRMGVAAGTVAVAVAVVGEGVEGFADVFFHAGVGGGMFGGGVFIDCHGAQEAIDLFGGGPAADFLAAFVFFLPVAHFLLVGSVHGDYHFDVFLQAGYLHAEEEDGEQEVENHGAHDAAAV